VFDWPAAVGHSLRREGDAVSIVFDRAFTADLAPAKRALGALIAGIVLGPDGKTVVVTLRPGTGVTSFEAEARVVVDFTAGAVADAAEAPAITVRGNEEGGRLRIVFDWPEPVGFRESREGDVLRLRFDRAARFDLGGLDFRAITLASSLEPEADGEGARIRLKAGANAEVGTVGDRIVVDVRPGTAASTAEAPEVALPPLPSAKPAAILAAAEPAAPAAVDSAVRAPTMVLPAAFAREGATIAARDSAPRRMALRPVPPARTVGALWPMLARVIGEADGAVRLRFIVNRPVALAALVRRNIFLVAFDGPFDAIASGMTEGSACADLARMTSSGGTVLACTVPEGYGAEVTREGHVWEVRLAPGAYPPARPLEPEMASDLEIVIDAQGGGAPIGVTPTMGDPLSLVPLPAPGQGIAAARTTLGYQLIPTSQGIGLAGLAAGVGVVVGPDEVALVLEGAAGSLAADGLLDVRGLAMPPEALTKKANALALDEDIARRSRERLDLARRMLASGFVVEAWGQIRRVAEEAPQIAARPDVQALAGAVLTRLGRVNDAAKFLDDPLLGGAWVDLWRTALDSRKGDYGRAAQRFRGAAEAWAELPDGLRRWIGLEMARGLALAGEPSIAKAVLLIAVGEKPIGAERDKAILVAGYIRDALGEPDAAIQVWHSLAQSDDRLVAAEARFAIVEARVRASAIMVPDAIEALEQLSFAWRGGDVEGRRLRMLADLYVLNRQHREALATLRTLITYVPEAADAQETARQMAALFKDVMIGPASQYVSPLGSLAVFQDFQELTPVGADGDALIEQLAERLAAVDLVAQAGDLLEQQLAGRLKGEARVRVGVRVAELRLAAGDPEAALHALDAIENEPLAAAFAHRKRMAAAHAYAGLERLAEANEALAGDLAPDAVWLRADMAWRDGDWPAATSHIESLLSRTSVKEGPWGDRADLALRLAVGYATAGDVASTVSTGRRFERLFKEDPRRDMFATVT
jgi:hypothetical protein